MSRPSTLPYRIMQTAALGVTAVALGVSLTACEPDNTRPPDERDVVRAPRSSAPHPCRCSHRPPLERTTR